VNRLLENTNRNTLGRLALGLLLGVAGMLAACTQGPGGNGIGLASGQEPDPATVDFPIFYIRHQVPEEQDVVTRVRPFVEDDDYSATLWKRDRASPGAAEVEITARLRTAAFESFGFDAESRFDIKDLAVAPDGLHLAFALRGPLDDFDEDEMPTWNIWEYDIATDALRRVISSEIIAEDGQDVAPSYLPDGRIVFSSTRQRQAKAILIDEGKEQFEAATEARNESAFVLHVMNADGTDIHQISFNPSSDLYGQVLQNGRLLFTRWDRAPGRDGLHLYTSNPDGTDMQLHYGALSHLTGSPSPTTGQPTTVEFMRAREMSDGRIMVLTRQRTNVDFGGNLTIISANSFVENTQTTLAAAGTPGPAQTPATLNDVRTVPGPSPGGRFNSGFPLWDGSGRILVSWTQCRLLDTVDPTRIVPCTSDRLANPDAETAPPLYSIWMFTPSQNTILPVMSPVEGVMVTEAVAAQPRNPLPAVILDKKPPADLDADLVAEGAGLLSIRSVYDIMGVDQARTTTGATNIANVSNPTLTQYQNRLARFVRIEKPVAIPDDDDIADPDNSAFGPTGVMRQIVAYAPVEPDGSVRMKVPANVAFQISILDANGRRFSPIHRSWLQVRPGEVLECNGCHARTATTPMVHGRKGLFNSVYTGATGPGVAFPGAATGISPGETGDTMARARSRAGSSCIDATTMAEHCGLQSITPSANVVYNEIWKQAPVVTDSFSLDYQALTTPSPANVGCFPVWTPTCRITIHYIAGTNPVRPGHIHPLWSLPRPVAGVIDGTGNVTYPFTCTNCHNRLNPLDNNVVQVPAASLELTDEDSNQDALQKQAYRHLLFVRDELEIVAGAVVPRQVPGPPDANGNPTFTTPQLPASMAAGNARNSRFFNVMNNATHAGMLSPAELRLLSEWLDIGAQYYNDPFPPTPQN